MRSWNCGAAEELSSHKWGGDTSAGIEQMSHQSAGVPKVYQRAGVPGVPKCSHLWLEALTELRQIDQAELQTHKWRPIAMEGGTCSSCSGVLKTFENTKWRKAKQM